MIPKDLGGRGAKPRHVKFSSGMNTGCKPFIFLQNDFGGLGETIDSRNYIKDIKILFTKKL